MKYKRYISLAMLMAFLFVFAISAFAAPTPQPPPAPEPTSSSDDTPWYRLDVKIEKMYESVTLIVSSIKEFFEDGVTGVVEKTQGIMLESFLNINSFNGKWVFSTPRLIQFPWIRSLWWISFSFSMVSMAIGVGITILKVFAGKKSNNSINLLRSFIIAIVGCSLSLYVSDYLIDVSNLFMNSLANKALVSEYKKPENQSAIIIQGLDEDKIGFDSFDGKSLGKMAFGASLNEETPFYEIFLTSRGGGGAYVMNWAMYCFIIMGIFSTLRYGTLGLLGALSPLWISVCAWTGDETPALGYINLFLRSVLLSYIFDIAWLMSYFVINNPMDFQGIGPQILACIVFTVSIIFSFYFWFKWFKKAVFQPVTLAGAQAKEWLGDVSGKVGNVTQKIGSRFGFTEQPSSQYLKNKRSRTNTGMEAAGNSLPDLPRNGGISDRLKDAEHKNSRKSFKKQGQKAKNATTYYQDSKGSYHYYNNSIGRTVKHSTPPKSGVKLSLIKSSKKLIERSK